MTCLKGRVLSGARMKFHTSMLGTFLYTLGLSIPIFKKKPSLEFQGKSSKLWVINWRITVLYWKAYGKKSTIVCKRSDASVNYLMLKQLADASRPLVLVQLYVAFIFLKKGQVN